MACDTLVRFAELSRETNEATVIGEMSSIVDGDVSGLCGWPTTRAMSILSAGHSPSERVCDGCELFFPITWLNLYEGRPLAIDFWMDDKDANEGDPVARLGVTKGLVVRCTGDDDFCRPSAGCMRWGGRTTLPRNRMVYESQYHCWSSDGVDRTLRNGFGLMYSVWFRALMAMWIYGEDPHEGLAATDPMRSPAFTKTPLWVIRLSGWMLKMCTSPEANEKSVGDMLTELLLVRVDTTPLNGTTTCTK